MVADGSINIGAWIGVSVWFIVIVIIIGSILRWFISSNNSYNDGYKPKKSGIIRCGVCGAVNIRHNCVDEAWKVLTSPNLQDVALKQEAEEQKLLSIKAKEEQEKRLEKELGTENYRQLKAIRYVMPEYLRKLDEEKREEERLIAEEEDYKMLEEEVKWHDAEYSRVMSEGAASSDDKQYAHDCFRTARELESSLYYLKRHK